VAPAGERKLYEDSTLNQIAGKMFSATERVLMAKTVSRDRGLTRETRSRLISVNLVWFPGFPPPNERKAGNPTWGSAKDVLAFHTPSIRVRREFGLHLDSTANELAALVHSTCT
jgi:hypothetical protein